MGGLFDTLTGSFQESGGESLGKTLKNMVIFASRGIGVQVVEQALERGREVAAPPRDHAKLEINHPRLTKVRRDTGNLSEARSARAEKDREEELIKSFPANRLILRPGFPIHGPGTRRYRVLSDLAAVVAGKISRADVSDFILNQLESLALSRQTARVTD